MDRQETLNRLCQEHGLLAVYLFGSRADDGLRLLQGEAVSREGSDLDIGVFSRRHLYSSDALLQLQVEFEAVLTPLRLNLVALEKLSSLSQYEAIGGYRIAAPDPAKADSYELFVMNMASEMFWLEQQAESEEISFSHF